MTLSVLELTGRVDSHLVFDDRGRGLQAECWRAFESLRRAAASAGFDLQVASAFRSFQRQLDIWNAKARGERPVHDDLGTRLELGKLARLDRVLAILRFSALPGASRHHWGTDLDVFDAAAVPPGYQLQLSPDEVATGGLFAPLHEWLDQRMDTGEAFGFERPYAVDTGGVSPERWHLSYAPLSRYCAGELTVELLQALLCDCDLELRQAVLDHLPDLHRRFIHLA